MFMFMFMLYCITLVQQIKEQTGMWFDIWLIIKMKNVIGGVLISVLNCSALQSHLLLEGF